MVRSAGFRAPGRRLRRARSLAVVSGLSAAVFAAGCASDDGRQLAPAVQPAPPPPTTAPPSTTVPTIELLAPWAAGGEVSPQYACGAGAAAPALTWFDTDVDAVEYLLTIAVGGEFTDALVAIPATASGLGETELPAGAFWWPPTDVGRRWQGVCGAPGAFTTFTLYALNQQLELADDADVAEVASIAELTAVAHDTVSGFAPAAGTTPTP